MALTITTYINSSARNVARKNLRLIETINGNIKDNIDILHPQIYAGNVFEFNYCYIKEFDRYYYVASTEKMSNGSNLITLDVDVLQSHIEALAEIEATITRNENMSNAYLLDDQYKALSYTEEVVKNFPKSIDDDSIVIMTVG